MLLKKAEKQNLVKTRKTLYKLFINVERMSTLNPKMDDFKMKMN